MKLKVELEGVDITRFLASAEMDRDMIDTTSTFSLTRQFIPSGVVTVHLRFTVPEEAFGGPWAYEQ